MCELALQYMHSLNIDIEKMEEEIRKLDVEATNAVEENKGKNDNWQQVSVLIVETACQMRVCTGHEQSACGAAFYSILAL